MQNSIRIEYRIDGFFIRATATYDESVDGWTSYCKEVGGPYDQEIRGPDETGNDVPATLWDMIDLALDSARQRVKWTT